MFHFSTYQGNNVVRPINHENSTELIGEAIDRSTSTSSILQNAIMEMEIESFSDDDGDHENVTCQEIIQANTEIDTYKVKRLDIDTDIMAYWEDNKYVFPFLAKLAAIVHGVPATEVSVERAFSALNLILDDQRCNLSDENLKKILFVKLNYICIS